MTHFIKKLIQSPILVDPAKNHKDIHRHYYRYSKGDFIGPALKISKTKARINLKGTHEYEDLISEIVVSTVPEDEKIKFTANLITGSEISETINNLGFDWNLKKSTGKTKNYKTDITDITDNHTLLKLIDVFRENSYFLLSFNLNPTCKLTTKKRIPQPSKKKVEDDDISKRIQFCKGVINNTESNINLILNLALEDFKSDLPTTWKNIIITNNYKITEIELPKNVKNSMLLRLLAIRKGKMYRSINVDGEMNEKQYNIVV
ncbi:MAG: hypothetical protein KAW66_09845 [Candidatus Lokiarchaeota archaeon]|nr:hypothetical protein [Candidatus Lokiarchaeota archaeon]